MESSLALFCIIIALALALGFTNGLNDAANAIATAVGTRSLSPRTAIAMAAVFNFVGAATGIAVAKTIGKGILGDSLATGDSTAYVLIAGLLAIVLWGQICTRFGIPISLTHGVVAGLVGAGAAVFGWNAVDWWVLGRVLIAVIAAPALGFLGGGAIMTAIMWIFQRSTPSNIYYIFSKLQILASGFMAYSHGKNDGQMPIGVILAGLVYYTGEVGYWKDIPFWIIAASAASISLGTALGGWRVMHTVGSRITAMQPVHGFAAQSAGAGVIEVASIFGIPVSTTHCISASVIGVGTTKRLSAVRWGVAGDMMAAWILTFPACGIVGYLLSSLFKAAFL
jgi:PiT family inorganic phosphate transporter